MASRLFDSNHESFCPKRAASNGFDSMCILGGSATSRRYFIFSALFWQKNKAASWILCDSAEEEN